jgi:uncharacterized protein (DUF2336 family)
VLAALMRRDDLDADTAELVGETVRRRMREAAADEEREDKAKSSGAASGGVGEVERLFKEGKLNDTRIGAEMTSGNRAFVSRALALKADLPDSVVERIAAARSAKAITALAWKAGFPCALPSSCRRVSATWHRARFCSRATVSITRCRKKI